MAVMVVTVIMVMAPVIVGPSVVPDIDIDVFIDVDVPTLDIINIDIPTSDIPAAGRGLGA